MLLDEPKPSGLPHNRLDEVRALHLVSPRATTKPHSWKDSSVDRFQGP
jgi:hypothetical protein